MVGLIRGLGNEAAESSHIRRRDGNVEFFEKIALQCIDLSTGLHECGGAALSDHQHAIVRINLTAAEMWMSVRASRWPRPRVNRRAPRQNVM